MKDAKVAQFRPIQKALVQYFGGDPACVNESRVMRLPGFYHCKKEPVLVECISFHPERRYTQEQLAEKAYVTRQAVSRWENGETVPGTETLKLLSRFFDVSINTLLGSPQKLVCQCCGMPLEDSLMSREIDGDINEKYCKWCYNDGKFKYLDMNTLIDFCVNHMASEEWPEERVRQYMGEMLPKLEYWKEKAE